jgi:hypothetical protein
MARRQTALQATRAADLAEAEDIRTREAYDMRRAGASWWKIAEALSISEQNAKDRVTDAINTAADMVGEHRKRQMLMLQLDRLDELILAQYKSATEWGSKLDSEGNAVKVPPSIEAGRHVADLVMKQAKLMGLDDMVSTTVTQQTVVVAGTSEEYVAALRLVVGGRATPAEAGEEDIEDAELVDD